MYINETIKNTVQTKQNTVNTSTHITKHAHIKKNVKITTVQDTHQMK